MFDKSIEFFCYIMFILQKSGEFKRLVRDVVKGILEESEKDVVSFVLTSVIAFAYTSSL